MQRNDNQKYNNMIDIDKIIKNDDIVYVGNGFCDKCENKAIQFFIYSCGDGYYNTKNRCERHKYKVGPAIHPNKRITKKQVEYFTTRYEEQTFRRYVESAIDFGIERLKGNIYEKAINIINEMIIKEIIT